MPIPGALDVFSTPDGRPYPSFTSGDAASTRAVIFIGGLFNGLGDVPYLPALSAALSSAGWKLVQFHWTSAYNGFGMSSLDVDVAEMSALSAHLRANGTKTVVVMGHSTGSQNVIHYLTSSGTRTPVDGGIMQAPVSDREHFGVATDAMSAAWRAALPQATALVAEGKGETILSGDDLGLRITAYRLHSFLSIAGDDDYFSSDLPTEPDGKARHPLSTSFGALRTPALALFSEKDEFAHIPDPQVVLDRWVGLANGHLSTAIVPGASHAVNDPAHQPALVAETLSWLEKTFK